MNGEVERTIRTFVCLELPDEVAGAISLRIKDWRRDLREVRWTRPENIHITLKFCGNITEHELKRLAYELETAPKYGPVELAVGAVDAFPNRRSPRTIVCALSSGIRELHRIKEKVENAAQAAGLRRDDRRFRPHITLGRVRSPERLGRKAAETLFKSGVETQPWAAETMTLMKSRLTPEGPIYTPEGFFKI